MGIPLPNAPKSKVLVSADGTKVYADAIGDPSKAAVVFIHGFSLGSVVFDSIFSDQLWIDQVYLVRYDMRGHGRSGKPIDEASWESKRLADDFDAVVEGFELVKPFVVGWSLGASNITDILLFHPASYLSGIVYLTPMPYMGPILYQVASPASLGCLPRLQQTEDVTKYQEAALEFVALCSAFSSYQMQLACLGNFVVQPRAVTNRVLTRTQDESGLLKAGREAGLPLLIIDAKKDKIIKGEIVPKAVEGWKNLKVMTMEDADHMPWMSHPDTLRQGILDWINEVRP